MSARYTITILGLATMLGMSESWTREHWREIRGLPAPVIGGAKYCHLRWRRSDIDAFFAGKDFEGAADVTEREWQATDPPHDQEISAWKQALLKGL